MLNRNLDGQGIRVSKHSDSISIKTSKDANQIMLLSVLRVEGVIGPQGGIQQFYEQLGGDLEKDVSVFSAFVPIENPLREKRRMATLRTKTPKSKSPSLRKGTKDRLQRLLQTDFWKISVLIHVKSNFITETDDVDENQEKMHQERVIRVIGAWNAEFRPSKVKLFSPRQLSNLYPSTSSGVFILGSTQTVLQLTKLPKRIDVAPRHTFELPPNLPIDLVLGKAMAGRNELSSEPVGLSFTALQSSIAIFGADMDQRKQILEIILNQTQQQGLSSLILDSSGNYTMPRPGQLVMKPGIDFYLAPLSTEGLSPEQYTDLFIRALNLFLELPESRLGELVGLLLTLYEDLGLEQTSLHTLQQTLSGEFSGDEESFPPSIMFDTYNLRGVASLLTPLLHGRSGAAFSGPPNRSTIKHLESQFSPMIHTIVIDLSEHTIKFKQFFMALLASKLLAYRQGQFEKDLASKGIILVLDDVDFHLRHGDYKINQRTENFLPILSELGHVKVGLIALGATPETLWKPAFSLIARNLILSQLSPDAARFIETYLDLASERYEPSKRKFLQRLGTDNIVLVKRHDHVEPFLCSLDSYSLSSLPVGSLSPRLSDQKPVTIEIDKDILFNSDSIDIVDGILAQLMHVNWAPYSALLSSRKEQAEIQIVLLDRMEDYGLIKMVESREHLEKSVIITPVGRLYYQKQQKSNQSTHDLKLLPRSDDSSLPDLAHEFESTETSKIKGLKSLQNSQSRKLIQDWVSTKTLFLMENSEAWDLLKNILQESLIILYISEHQQEPQDIETILKWIQTVSGVVEYLKPELEEVLLSQENSFDVDVFTSDILEPFENLFAAASGYPRVISRTTEVELLVGTHPVEALKKAVSLIIDVFGLILDLRQPPAVNSFGCFIEAFSKSGNFLPHKTSLREYESLFLQISHGESQDYIEKCSKALENFTVVLKELESSILDLNLRMAGEIRQVYNQLVRESSERPLKRELPPEQISRDSLPETPNTYEDNDEVLSDLLAVGSEELVLIDCGRFIREGLGTLLTMDMEHIHLDQAKNLLTLIINDDDLKIPWVKGAKRVLDALSFLIETGELPAEDIAKLANTAQKFAKAMMTYQLDSTEKNYLHKLFQMAGESESDF